MRCWQLRRLSALAVALAASAPSLTAACSGPGAMEAIERSEALGWLLLLATIALCIAFAALASRWGVGWRRLRWLIVLPAVHPGWWLGARGGDCGSLRLLGSIGMTAITAMVVAAMAVIVWRRRARRS